MKSFVPSRYVAVFAIHNKEEDKYYIDYAYHFKKKATDIIDSCINKTFKNKELVLDVFKLGKQKFRAITIDVLYTYEFDEEVDFAEFDYYLKSSYNKAIAKYKREGKKLYNITTLKSVLIVNTSLDIKAEYKTQGKAAKFLGITRSTINSWIKYNNRFLLKGKVGLYPIESKDYESIKKRHNLTKQKE